MKKALNVIGNILIVVVLIFAVLITVMVITSTTNDNRIPSLFGYALLNVESDSMESPEGFYTGDLIVIRLLSEEESNNLEVGAVITFNRYFKNQAFLETHRIAGITDSIIDASQGRSTRIYKDQVIDGVWKRGGTSYYATAGDNTVGIDYREDGEVDLAYPGVIIGEWEGIRIPHVGAAIKFLQSQMGFMLCIVVPLSLFFFYQLYAFIVAMNNRKKETALAEVAAKQDEIKQKAVEEFLAQQQAQQPDPAAEPADPEAVKQQVINDYVTQQAAQQQPAPETAPLSEEEIKQKAIEEYIAQQEAAKKTAEAEEEIKKKAIEEYLASQAAEKPAAEDNGGNKGTE